MRKNVMSRGAIGGLHLDTDTCPKPATAGSRSHRAWRRLATTLTTLVTVAFLVGDIPPAVAATSLTLSTTGSSNTT
ncbi:MAG: hypothetical protein QOD63_890, partial [Actinomycetota bacterium]|nr:hypothetical protein [Actinomycetota bacterium]